MFSKKNSVNQWHNTLCIKTDRFERVFSRDSEFKEYHYIMSVTEITARFVNNIGCIQFDDVNDINIHINHYHKRYKSQFKLRINVYDDRTEFSDLCFCLAVN